MGLGDPAKRVVRDARHPDRRHRPDIVIELLQQKSVKVDEIAPDMKLHDLPLAVGEILVAADDPVDEQGRGAERRPRPDEGSACRILLDLADRGAKHPLLLVADQVPCPQLEEKARDRIGGGGIGHLNLHRVNPSAAPAPPPLFRARRPAAPSIHSQAILKSAARDQKG